MTLPPRKKKKNGRIRSRRVWVVVAVFAVGVTLIIGKLMLLGVGAFFADDFLTSTERRLIGEEARGAIEQTLKTELPATAENFYFYYTGWQDYILRFRMEMSSQDAEALMDSIVIECLQQPLQYDITPFLTIESESPWWHPSTATSYQGIPQCGNNPYWSMMIDQSDPDRWILYFRSFST